MKPFFVYLLRCADGSYYVGHTDDLERRVAEHQSGEIPGYTHELRPVSLVWSQETATREEALAAELRIKGWGRAKKEALMAGNWERVSLLARSRNGLPSTGSGQSEKRAQPERFGGAAAESGDRLRQAQPERKVSERGLAREELHANPAHPEPVFPTVVNLSKEGPAPEQAHRESNPAHPEPVFPTVLSLSKEGPVPEQAHPTQTPTHPEPVFPTVLSLSKEGSAPQQAHAAREPVHPEPVEGPALSDIDEALVTGLAQSQRRALAKSITLLESTRPDHRTRADALLNAILPRTGNAIRLGISGVPGVGKSTFIEALGLMLIGKGHRVAVLAIDPSSSVSGGSILGDKTRMEMLSVNPAAYIRPSPASGTLGGVAEKTREAMLVCEAAGYDVVIVETVGVGQSETAVASMTDMFVLLQLPNAGDDLQAIKKGVMELADLVVINKADIDPDAAMRAEAHISGSLRMFGAHAGPEQWVTRVIQMSALKSQGIDAFWRAVEEFHTKRRASGEFEARRKQQSLAWMWDIVHARLHADFRRHAAVRAALPHTLRDVTEARLAPSSAARALLALFEQQATS